MFTCAHTGLFGLRFVQQKIFILDMGPSFCCLGVTLSTMDNSAGDIGCTHVFTTGPWAPRNCMVVGLFLGHKLSVPIGSPTIPEATPVLDLWVSCRERNERKVRSGQENKRTHNKLVCLKLSDAFFDERRTHQGFGPKPIRSEYEIESSPGADYVACHHTCLGADECYFFSRKENPTRWMCSSSCSPCFTGTKFWLALLDLFFGLPG